MTQTDRALGLTGTRGMKDPCVVATTANITLSGIQTIDGIVLEADDRVLVKDQTDGSENGIYLVKTGAWVRAADWDGDRDIRHGTMMSVSRGTVNGLNVFHVNTVDPISVGTTSVQIDVRTTFSVSTFMESFLDDTTAGDARNTLDAASRTTDETVTADKTYSGDNLHSGELTVTGGLKINTNHVDLTGKAINHGVLSVAAHASTCDIWSGGNEVTLTGSAVTFTDLADAPQAGAVRWVRMNAAHIWTDNAALEVMGNANFTCEDGDMVRVTAKTTTTFKIDIFPIDGSSVVAAAAATTQSPTIQVFNSSGTWNRPSGCKGVRVTCIGAGGGGTFQSTAYNGGGGGGGTAIRILDVTSIASVTVTVGAGVSAAAGGNSTFGSYATGNGGSAGTTASSPGGGGGGSNGNYHIHGTVGEDGTLGAVGGFSMLQRPGNTANFGGGSNPTFNSEAIGGSGVIIVEEFY